MLEQCRSARERWGGVNEIIDRWLKARQDLLILLLELGRESDTRERILESFCQILMDYTSAGYFEVYDQLIKEGQAFHDDAGLEVAQQLFKIIDGTTEVVLDFNDKYEATDDLGTLELDLSRLAEMMAVRFEAEDRMIAVLHLAHSTETSRRLPQPHPG